MILAGIIAVSYAMMLLACPGYFMKKEDREEFEQAFKTKEELKNNDRIYCN